ncbi:MAG: DUF488 family protein [Candidatus Tyrphobacter sp.]
MPQTHRASLPRASPKQQAERKAIWNEARSAGEAHFFTVGYTGRNLVELLGLLEENHVHTLVDIRFNPVSMYRPELSKTNLQRHVESRGLVYTHLRELGVPTSIRSKAAEVGSREYIWQWYDRYVVPLYPGRNLHRFLNSLEHPVALMCVEIDPGECHRHRLFVALEELGLKGYDL